MNAAQRTELSKLQGELDVIAERLREIADDEQSKFDNLPEGLQQAENGQKLETAASALSEAADSAESASSSIGEALE